MFGYVTINPNALGEEDKQRYQALYCGLCRQLSKSHGAAGRMTLTYDMVFLSMLLSSLYKEEEIKGVQRCPMHPLKPKPYIQSPATEYAADLSVVLAYYKCMDDWNDDHNVIALGQSKLLKECVKKAGIRYPRQCAAVASGIKRLGEIEQSGEINPDIPANCFGNMMGELFVREDVWEPALRRMGAALGRFVYLMDAANDLRDDIRKKRYNPLTAQTDTDFEPMLTMLIGECTREFEKLPLERDGNIMRDILYSGVWMRFRKKERAD